MALAFNYIDRLIEVQSPQAAVDCQSLYDAIAAEQASARGIVFSSITSASGKQFLGPGVQVGLILALLGGWQLHFWPGSYVAQIGGGNLVGDGGADPVAYTPGVQVLLIQSAASTVVTMGGTVPSATENAAAVLAAMAAAPPPVDVEKVHGVSVRGSGTDNDPWGPAG
jgi:hypothetical protein